VLDDAAFMAIDVQRVLVVGAGTMGTGIAQVAARAGYRTEIFDVASGVAQRSVERVGDSLARAVEKGRCTGEERAQALERLGVATELDGAAAAADLIIEAAPEDLELKRQLFARFSRLARPDAILATNTSSLPITAIAAAAKGPERVVGLHFFNPVPAMKLLEIVQGERTHPMVVTAARAVGARLGKEVVVVRDAPGFATSRLGIALAMEAIRMLEEGVASAEEIDRAIELGYGHPMGPLKLTDHVGLDVRLAIAEHLTSELGERFRPTQLLRRLVRAGKLGKKSGEGFYRY
jgi:3-hydroxybutyryl-CoA dehydrogenase